MKRIEIGPDVVIHVGDVIDGLRQIPDGTVQCCVSSPPYWGLRDYGVEGQIGLEPTPEAFIAKMVEVYREVRRVLRSDGTCWMNLGDSYSNSRCGPQGESGQMAGRSVAAIRCRVKNETRVAPGLKPKDLCGIPWRVALALQADGWWLRQDIVWHKPNPMPESVTDRCTKSHEYIFLLTKSARYHYDAEAVKEKGTGQTGSAATFDRTSKEEAIPGQLRTQHREGRGDSIDNATRNKRSVWTIATQPYPEAHFATFPEAIPETCVLASTSPKACGVCGAPWRRVVEKPEGYPTGSYHDHKQDGVAYGLRQGAKEVAARNAAPHHRL